jgi:hypothetical protein
MERGFPYLRADLNAFGHGYVDLGRVAPGTAERLADLVARGWAITRPAVPELPEGEGDYAR